MIRGRGPGGAAACSQGCEALEVSIPRSAAPVGRRLRAQYQSMSPLQGYVLLMTLIPGARASGYTPWPLRGRWYFQRHVNEGARRTFSTLHDAGDGCREQRAEGPAGEGLEPEVRVQERAPFQGVAAEMHQAVAAFARLASL